MTTTLIRSKDRKVANAVTPKGTPAIANAFGLPAGRAFSCPSATDYCSRICYAGKIEKIYKGVNRVLQHNFEALNTLSVDGMVELLSTMVEEFRADCVKRDAPMLFRIHWDGDFFSSAYTVAWTKVIREFSDVNFWVYTRVPSAALFLNRWHFANLSLYFSADRDNLTVARTLSNAGIRIAYVDETFADGKAEFAKAVRCPENNRALPLADGNGSACAKCGLCIFGRNDVLFSRTKR